MVRSDLLAKNGSIFKVQREAFSNFAKKTVKLLITKIATKMNVTQNTICNTIIWGNNFNTQVPDLSQATLELPD
jgi:malate/lactate dehydrogenase